MLQKEEKKSGGTTQYYDHQDDEDDYVTMSTHQSMIIKTRLLVVPAVSYSSCNSRYEIATNWLSRPLNWSGT